MSMSVGLDIPLVADAESHARALDHQWIAPEHLLLAIAADATTSAGAFLNAVGFDVASLRDDIDALVGARPFPSRTGPLMLAQRSQVAIGEAIRRGRGIRNQATAFSADEMLDVLLSEDIATTGVIGGVLARHSMTPADARARLLVFRAAKR